MCSVSRLALLSALVLLDLTLPATAEYQVSVVPSDDSALANPGARDETITADQVLAMVRHAVDLVGGMHSVVAADAKVVLLKPNIGTRADPRTGVNTDDRVVRAVAILVHEAAPEARILIAEGAGGWISPELRHLNEAGGFGDMYVDGFEKSGHRATVRELQASGVDIDCFDLNFDKSYSLHPENGGLADSEYSIAAAIMDADVWINIPVAKTHGAKITCSLKNHFGILPGNIYGWSKSNGTSRHRGMPHSPRQMDEAWIDLYGLTRVDLNVVDMITGSEAGPFEEDHRKRANIILAGRNPVATDLVVAQLMGYNPDDFEFAELAWLNALGPRTIDEVDIRGAAVLPLVQRYKKAGVSYGGWGEWAEHANYGMGPRYWTLLGPMPLEQSLSQTQIADLAPVPGSDGWSEIVYFGSDRINLDKHFDDPANCAVYAFTRFTMSQTDSVRFWFGSDEGMQVWLDGELIHSSSGRRSHSLGMDKIHGFVTAGEHRLVVRAEQGRGAFDFSINVCEPIDDELYAGNRYPGVRYYVESRDQPQVAIQRVGADASGGDYVGSDIEANITTLQAGDPIAVSRSAPDTVVIDPAPLATRGDLLGLLAELSGTRPGEVDPVALEILGSTPFTIGHIGFGREGYFPGYGPEITRLLDWLGLRYAISYGYGHRESLKTIHGWLAQGYVPVTGNLELRQRRRWRGSQAAEWGAVTGYRESGDAIELRMVRLGKSFWTTVTQDWTGVLPGGLRGNCPVLVARSDGQMVSGVALVDSIAGLALELGLTLEITSEQDWGTTTTPGGIAAWDWWVIDWERLPFTEEWASEPRTLDRLERLASRYPPELSRQRALAARYFSMAATQADNDERRSLLQATADGYQQVAESMEQLAASMPQVDEVADLTPEDKDRLANIVRARPLVGRARQGERQALAALATLLGRPGLPAILTDPLSRKQEGIKLFSWSAVTEDTVYELQLSGEDLEIQLLEGPEASATDSEVFAAMPRKPGWIVTVEPALTGSGTYRVVQQPTVDNDWRIIVHADDSRAWNRDNAPNLIIWAVPGD